MKQQHQMTFEQALTGRNIALERVDAAADSDWREMALEAVRQTCNELDEFISDDIWTISGLEAPEESRALGPVMLRAARLGWCAKTDRVRPSVRSHLSGKPVWRSRLRGES